MPETNPTETPYTALGFYHKISQLRADTWNALKRDLGQLVRQEAASPRARTLVKAVDVKLTRLEIIEDYQRFPPRRTSGISGRCSIARSTRCWRRWSSAWCGR